MDVLSFLCHSHISVLVKFGFCFQFFVFPVRTYASPEIDTFTRRLPPPPSPPPSRALPYRTVPCRVSFARSFVRRYMHANAFSSGKKGAARRGVNLGDG